MNFVTYQERHIGPDAGATEEMLRAIGVSSLDELIKRTVPQGIRSPKALDVGPALTEREHLDNMKALGAKNKVFRSYIGLGFSGTVLPPAIQRNVFENPGWYTAYTPYQAEIAQGRLEALLNFQTMVSELTGLPIANASLLDEATAIAEAMHMLYAARPKELANAHKFFADKGLYPQNIDVLRTRCAPIGVELVVGDAKDFTPDGSYFGRGAAVPAVDGSVGDHRALVSKAKAAGVRVAVCADILSLVLLTPPGEWGADVCVGNSQRFGVPMGYGGPHAAFFATTEEYKRLIPGRIIGVSQDRRGRRGLRMALQTREQHIRRDKATSNICTAQALLAVMAGMYAVYHGPSGLKRIAGNVHAHTRHLAEAAKGLGYGLVNASFFDTITLTLPAGIKAEQVKKAAEARSINFRYEGDRVSIALDETVRPQRCGRYGGGPGGSLWRQGSGCPGQRFHHGGAGRSAAHERGTDASGVQHPPHRTRAPALHQEVGEQGLQHDARHDPPGLVHDEAERRQHADAVELARMGRPASLRSGGPDAGLPAGLRRTERCAGEGHGLHGREPAAQQRCAGRIRRSAGDPRVPCGTR